MTRFRFLILSLLCLTLATGIAHHVLADTPTPAPSSTSLDDINKKISDLQAKISDLQGQEKTLSSQIKVMDNELTVTQYKMEATKEQIVGLTTDINTATKKVTNLETSLDDITKVLLSHVVATYEVGSVQSAQILLTSSNITDFLSRTNYLRIAQAHDRKLMFETQQARNDYQNQKNIFEQKKQQVEALKKQLEDEQAQMEQQKKDKEALLAKTKNDDSLYQKQLEAAQAEQVAIQQIAAGGGNTVEVGDISQGSTVGYMISGASACSSGTHLHFEVHKDGGIQDPSGFLSNKTVIFENSPDSSFSFSGSWSWPLDDPVRIEQGYGMTYWARTGWYGGGPHTGIDMFSTTSSAVHAVLPGKMFRGSIPCGGGQLLYARVDQDGGIQSYYLHILP